MKTKTKKKGTTLHDYYEALDLYAWWEQFSMSYADNGQHKYVTVHSFIKSKTKDKLKREFLWWLLGPKTGEPRNPEFAKYPQHDWESKRGKEFWLSSEKIEQIKRDASNRMSSIDEIKAIGSFNLDDMARIKILADQLDSEFGGRLQLPNLTAKENKIRLKNYFDLRSQLQMMLHNAQTMFAKTRSVDMAQLSEMLQVIGPSILGQVAGTQEIDPAKISRLNVIDQINEMVFKKVANYPGLELPDKEAKDIMMPKTITIDRKKVQ